MQFDVKKITLLDELCEESVKNLEEKKNKLSQKSSR